MSFVTTINCKYYVQNLKLCGYTKFDILKLLLLLLSLLHEILKHYQPTFMNYFTIFTSLYIITSQIYDNISNHLLHIIKL